MTDGREDVLLADLPVGPVAAQTIFDRHLDLREGEGHVAFGEVVDEKDDADAAILGGFADRDEQVGQILRQRSAVSLPPSASMSRPAVIAPRGWNGTSPRLAVRAQCGDQERQTKYDKYDADDEGGPRAQMGAA